MQSSVPKNTRNQKMEQVENEIRRTSVNETNMVSKERCFLSQDVFYHLMSYHMIIQHIVFFSVLSFKFILIQLCVGNYTAFEQLLEN